MWHDKVGLNSLLFMLHDKLQIESSTPNSICYPRGTLPNFKIGVIMTLNLGSLPPSPVLASWHIKVADSHT